MTTEPDSLPIQLAEGYRVARKNTSIFCALGLGWSAAQFDLKSISLGPAGDLDLSGASVAFILACGIAYTMTRCTIEFAMQTKEVRRWHLAQADFKLSVFVVRATVLILAASGLSRSVETVLYVAIAAIALLTASLLLELLFTASLLPLFIYMTNRRVGKERASTSIASRVIEATSWAELSTFVLIAILLICLGIASIHYARPGATLAGYKRVKLDPIEVAFHKDWDPKRAGSNLKLSTSERESIRAGVAQLVQEEFICKVAMPLRQLRRASESDCSATRRSMPIAFR